MIKTICGILILFLFSGCIQGSAFLGPAVTVAGTGNIHQAGLSYISSKTVKKITGKTPTENIKTFLKIIKILSFFHIVMSKQIIG